jgi:cytochrome P450
MIEFALIVESDSILRREIVMATVVSALSGKMPAAVRAERVPTPTRNDLAHLPGDDGLPLVGDTFRTLRDPNGYKRAMVARYGRVYRNRAFGFRMVTLLGADANELVLFDRDRNFSNELAWTEILGFVFPRGLLLMDFDEHRAHRKILSVAFKTGPMQSYMAGLNDGIRQGLAAWDTGRPFAFYPAIKELTLKLAAPCFLGIAWGPDADKINQAFVDMVAASVAPVRRPLPFTKMRRGVKARAFICTFLAREIPARRGRVLTGTDDMFTQLCHAADEDGNRFSDQDIIDHMNFMMMAAHDTITSSVSSLVWLLAKNPDWQDRLRQEISGLGLGDGDVSYDMLSQMPLVEMAFKEALRINPPVPQVPRRALRDFEFGGYKIPAGVGVNIDPYFVHHDPALWPDPEKFDPLRFTDDKVRDRHKYAWVPFGGGAHMCLGLHFAYMQAKVFFVHLLRDYRIERNGDAGDAWQAWPIPQPKDGLPITLVKI